MEPFNFCLPSQKKTHTLVQTHVGEQMLNLRWRLQNACLKQHKHSEALLTVKRKLNELCIICYTQSVSVQAVSLLLVSFFTNLLNSCARVSFSCTRLASSPVSFRLRKAFNMECIWKINHGTGIKWKLVIGM